MVVPSGRNGDGPELLVPVFPPESLDLSGEHPVFTDHDGGSVTLAPGVQVSFGGGYASPGASEEGVARGNGCAELDLFTVHAAD